MTALDFWFEDSLVTRLSRNRTPSGQAHLVLGGFPGEPPPSQRERYAHLLGRASISATLHQTSGKEGLAGEALILHGTRDTDIPIEESRRFAEAAGCGLREFEDDHTFSSAWDRMLSEATVFAAGEEPRRPDARGTDSQGGHERCR